MKQLFTLGHSSRTWEEFLTLINTYSITVICDVRSAPYSRYTPYYNKEPFAESLKEHGIHYVYLGQELGGRPEAETCYDEAGKVQYTAVMKTKLFQQGIQRLKTGLETYSIGLMCAERDPLTCHRMLLISRFLRQDLDIIHILDEDQTETQHQAERRLFKLTKTPEKDLLSTPDQLVEDAYDRQAQRIGYQQDQTARDND